MEDAKDILLHRRAAAEELSRLKSQNEDGVFDVRITQLKKQIRAVDRAIYKIPDPRLCMLLKNKYIRGLSNAQCARLMYYSLRHIHRLRRRAFLEFMKYYNPDK